MRTVPAAETFRIADHATHAERGPNPRGWYHSVGGVVDTPSGLVCCYRRSDAHCALYTDIMVAFSHDGGRSWHDHRRIAHLDVWTDHAVWIAPQLSRLRDGRLLILCDRGHRTPQNDWPMLTTWQKPGRGMANVLFESGDDGRSWSGPRQIDAVGGEPGYIVELRDATLLFTRTESAASDAVLDPPLPWGAAYYRCVVVASEDGGRTWQQRGVLSDDPFHGDCEVGLAELPDGELIALTRVGFGGGAFGQPSRLFRSRDGGRSWDAGSTTRCYAQRPILRVLDSGRLFACYRNVPGTCGSYAGAFTLDELLGYEPAARIAEEERCSLADGAMRFDAGAAAHESIAFIGFPALDGRAEVALDAEVRLAPDCAGVVLHGGCTLRAAPGRLALLREDGTELAQPFDPSRPRRISIRRDRDDVVVLVDGATVLSERVARQRERRVGIASAGAGRSWWTALDLRVRHPSGHGVDWSWSARDGFPDPFRRSRLVCLAQSADSGYGGCTQLDDGAVLVVDYSNHDRRHSMGGGPLPWLEAYRIEAALVGERGVPVPV